MINGSMNENNSFDPCSSSSVLRKPVMLNGLEMHQCQLSEDPPASPITTQNNENGQNKVLKRKVVSFSTMPFEKKVADGKDKKKISFFTSMNH